MPDELWTEVHDIVQETGIKTIPMVKKCKTAKWLSEEALLIAVKQRDYYYVTHTFPIFSLDSKLETSVYTTQGVHE